ncbi:MAG: tail fiber domain-containing protein [Proteobacteria bacterium]|nr:tail fiber domain-containing protein [Pseudomonadota bacterium]NBP14814.1 tail fiber domain-containing protein [bacterium]
MPLTRLRPTGVENTSTFTLFSALFTASINAVNTVTGAVSIKGGLGVGQDIHFGGNLYRNGVLFTGGGGSTASFATTASYAITATNLEGGDYGQIPVQSSTSTTVFIYTGSQNTVLVSNWPAGLPSWSNQLILESDNTSFSTQTGALVVNGGVGIGQDLYVGGIIYAKQLTIDITTITTTLIQTDDVIKTTNTTNATSTQTGALQISGGAGIGQNLYVGGGVNITGITTITNATEATSTTTGALIVTGGLGIGKNIVSRGSLWVGGGTIATGVAGEIRASNEITAYYGSDKNLKENIVPLSDAIEKINSIGGYEFDWKQSYIDARGGEDGYYVRKHDIGVIAQEIENVLPEIVGTRADGFKAVKYEKIVPLLIEAIKEQQKIINQILDVLRKNNIK